jgi:hypothetical protein
VAVGILAVPAVADRAEDSMAAENVPRRGARFAMRAVRAAALSVTLTGSLAALSSVTPLPAQAAESAAQATYATPEDAVAALIAAMQTKDPAAIRRVLGPGSEALTRSGDPVQDAEEHTKFLAEYAAKHELAPAGNDGMTLEVGPHDWPLPIPLVRTNGAWHFDSRAGAQELVDRRIGRNEIAAIRVCLAYVDAQQAYFDLFKEYRGTGAYAQLLVSTRGNYDGLYWPPAPGIPESPFGPLVAQAVAEGYPGELEAGKPVPYQGYFYRILKGQGPSAPGGTKSYVHNGRMTGGFALIAWPATYEASGIMTFIVNQDGVVFQKDLGPETRNRAAAIQRFDPDITWARVEVTPSQ